MLLMRAAAQLQAVQDDWNASSFEDIKEALTYNRRLWTVLVTSATEDSNPLPIELKQNIGSLGVFILRHTVDTLDDPKPERLTSLISINRTIAQGLRGN